MGTRRLDEGNREQIFQQDAIKAAEQVVKGQHFLRK